MSESVKYTNPLFVMNMAHDGYKNDNNRMGKGKVPTPYRFYYAGKFKRVYAMVYGNSPSLYIIHCGENLFLDAKTENKLYKITRGVF